MSTKAKDVANDVIKAANSANRMADNIDEINVSTTATMGSLAKETHDVASRARDLATDIDSINTKLTASANDLEKQVHDTGTNLYPIKSVFFYGLLAITAVSVVGILTGTVLLLFLREIGGIIPVSVSSTPPGSSLIQKQYSATDIHGKKFTTQTSGSSEQISRPSKFPMKKVGILLAIAVAALIGGVVLYVTGVISYLESIIADLM